MFNRNIAGTEEIAKDPADYRWSGYGEAVAGVRRAREGIRRVVFALGKAEGRFGRMRKSGARKIRGWENGLRDLRS